MPRASIPLEGGPSFSLRNRLLRAAWNVSWALLASWTPPQMRFWRRFLLKLFGAQLGESSDVRGSARVWYPPHLHLADRAHAGGAGQLLQHGADHAGPRRAGLAGRPPVRRHP